MIMNGGLGALWNNENVRDKGNIGTKGTLEQWERWNDGNVGTMGTLERWERWNEGNVGTRGTLGRGELCMEPNGGLGAKPPTS